MSMKPLFYAAIVAATTFSSMALAASASISWSGRVPSGEPVNVSTDGKVVTYDAWNKAQVEDLKNSSQFEVTPVSKEVSLLSVKL
ncbi:hypothetical protein OUO06_07595 [Photobacterium damselae]|uniref:hypothetical protein n=1 Tax=Photobacterium damselae TaxID=38293 RepID=UPI003C6E7D7D